MSSPRATTFYARTLLAVAFVWVFGVTVCSTRAMEMTAAAPHEHASHSAHDHHSDGAGHSDHEKSDECACSSFNSFPVQLNTLLKAPVPAVALLYTVISEEITFVSAEASLVTQNTGPPERVALSERIIERCLLNHAPPMVG